MFFLFFHSGWRWVVLLTLVVAVARAAWGLRAARGLPATRGVAAAVIAGVRFTAFDNALRHWTATMAHIQLVLGMTLFVRNPVADRFRIIHMAGMVIAVTVITIGSALAKRRAQDADKFATMFRWFLLGLVIILLFIPWPFSPLAQRPLFRNF